MLKDEIGVFFYLWSFVLWRREGREIGMQLSVFHMNLLFVCGRLCVQDEALYC